jgi:hypothetical protein
MSQKQCTQCNNTFAKANKYIAVCPTCYKKTECDLVQVVELENTRTFKDVNDATVYLVQLVNTYGPTPIVLDLHKVLDTTRPQDILPYPDKGKVCCSFVGKFSQTRALAQEDMQKRVDSGQIKWGVLVFKRGQRKAAHRFHEPGSKAWFCKVIQAQVFCDDSLDHVDSVQSYCPRITCFHIRNSMSIGEALTTKST